MLERIFRLRENGSTAGREVVAGLTTFAAMAYILAVNPAILKNAGMPEAALVTATALSAAVATLLMALMTNFPLALAPGMGINAFFAFSICIGMKVPWQSALGLVFINGCLFLLLSITGVREKILAAIPSPMKIAISAGIGLFIAFIGLENGGLIVANQATLVSMGDLSRPDVALFAGGILLTCLLIARGVPGAIIVSMAVVTALGLFVPKASGGTVTTPPSAWLSLPASLEPTFFKLNFDLLFTDHLKALAVILTLLLSRSIRQSWHADRCDPPRRYHGCERQHSARRQSSGRGFRRGNHQLALRDFDGCQLHRERGRHSSGRPDGVDRDHHRSLLCPRSFSDSSYPYGAGSRGGSRTRRRRADHVPGGRAPGSKRFPVSGSFDPDNSDDAVEL